VVAEKVNMGERLGLSADHRRPKVVGELNGRHVKRVKFVGEFVWHTHDHEGELFLVVEWAVHDGVPGPARPARRGRVPDVPHGVEHRPVSDGEVSGLLFEPASTLNTGDGRNERTVDVPERL
jgi:mannose-6-phosphate isomerase-like protein (cupin superfamily)